MEGKKRGGGELIEGRRRGGEKMEGRGRGGDMIEGRRRVGEKIKCNRGEIREHGGERRRDETAANRRRSSDEGRGEEKRRRSRDMITALSTRLIDRHPDGLTDTTAPRPYSDRRGRNPRRWGRVYLRLGVVVVKVVVGAVVGVVGFVQQLNGQSPAQRLRHKRMLQKERRDVSS